MSTDDTITAAGGWCAPTEDVYDFAVPAALGDAVVTAPEVELPRTPHLRMADPVVFPAPPSPGAADMIEATAENLLADYPYRTLLDCRQLAARLVDEVLTWDAMWPEAEGDCGCSDYMEGHGPECIWVGEARA